jgi:hypothetical protein
MEANTWKDLTLPSTKINRPQGGQTESRQSHKLERVGSIPTPATMVSYPALSKSSRKTGPGSCEFIRGRTPQGVAKVAINVGATKVATRHHHSLGG